MPTLIVYPTGPQEQALATLRYRTAAEALGWNILLGKEGVDTVYPERVREGDVVLIPRDFPRFFPAFQQVLAEARAHGKPVVYDLDDLLLAMPAEHPHLGDYQDALGGMAYAIIQADKVVVSTPFLRDLLRPLQPHIAVWPTLLPDALWPLRPPQRPNREAPLVVGYMGGTSHGPDVAMLTTVFQQLLHQWGERMELHFWGCPPPEPLLGHPQVQQRSVGVGSYAEFAAVFGQMATADIWLAPLVPNLFNRCKSSIKFWEYSAIGGVGVYSRLEPYEAVVEGENGVLASTEEEWLAAINQLADNPDLRWQMAHKAQETLREQGLMSTQLGIWQGIYESAMAEATSPPTNSFIQMWQRYSEAIQQRADGRDQEVRRVLGDYHTLEEALQTAQNEVHRLHYELQKTEQALEGSQTRNIVLQERSDQLEAILSNPRWRAWQQLKKYAQFDLKPLPPHQPFD